MQRFTRARSLLDAPELRLELRVEELVEDKLELWPNVTAAVAHAVEVFILWFFNDGWRVLFLMP